MVREKSKVRPHLIKWLKHVQQHEVAFGDNEIFLTKEGWYELYKIYYPRRDASKHITTLKQMTYYMSSFCYDKLIEGLSRRVISNPNYVICYKMDKHITHVPNEDRSVELPAVNNHTVTQASGQSPSK